jgi:uncharacterized repeat protein (TIGR01451 family)/fimbrial isopeptide formation D2 family protein
MPARRRSPAATALFVVLALLALLALPVSAGAAGSPNISVTTSSSSVLFGAPATVTLNASNPAGQPYGYNLSFRAVLPANTTYAAGSGTPAPTTVLVGQPVAGQTTLIWSNVSDLSPNSSQAVSFQVNHSQAAFAPGGSFAVTGEATINSDPRNVTQFNAVTGVPVGASYTGSATSSGTQSITAIKVTKSGGGSLLRGVHDHQTTYTTTATNNLVNQTTGVVLTDYLPAGIEYLGCGGAGADHTTDAATNPGSTQEYPGSGPIVVPAVGGCVAPTGVDTVVLDPDGAGPLPNATYTRLQWNLGTLAAGQVVNRPYRVGIPLRENRDTRWPNGKPTAASGGQAANLDNNSGPETDDEQALTSRADVAGNYNGVTPVTDATTMTTIAEDLVMGKSASSGSLVQTAITTWTLTFSTGEYRYSEGVTVTETLPNAYCPLGPVNYTTGNSPSDSQCDPTGALPSVPYSSVTENANGTYTIVWSPAALPQLTHATVNDSWSITFPTRTRTNYQSAFTDQGPVLAHDTTSNSVSLDGVALPRCTAPGAPDCNPTGPRIDHDSLITRLVVDAGSAGQTAPLPSIDKQIAQSGTNCATATYTNATPSYVPGDRICWLLNVNFPGGVDTAAPRVNDFLPPTVTYESGSDTATPSNTVGSTFDASGAAQGSLVWNLTGGLVPKGSQVFQHTISSVVQPTGQLAPGQLPGNLMKFSASGTSGVSFPYRDQADFVLAVPVIGLTKGVRQVNAGTINGPDVDGVTVKGGDTVTYRVDVGNTGTADAKNVVVWDLLPAEYDCATIGQITAISDAGTCVDAPFPAQDRIEWTVPALAQAATKMLTYKVLIPASIGPGRTLVNHAGVRSFQTQSNLGTFFTYTPASNIDAANATPANVPAADNFSNVVTRAVTIAKAATSPVDAPGNTAAQATIGENITYTVTTVIPDGTSVPANFKVADVVSARQVYQAGSVAATLNGSPLPIGWATSEVASTPTVTVPAAGFTASGGDATIVMTFIARVADLATNTRTSGNITNTASATWTDPVIGAQTKTSSATSIQVVEPLITQAKTDSVNPARAIPDQVVTYTLTTTNSNATRVSIAHDTKVVDVVPAGLTPIDVAPGNLPLADGATVPGTGGAVWNQGARTITRSGVDLNPNSSLVMTYRARVDNPAVAGNTLTNSATATTTSMAGTVSGERSTASASNTGYQSTVGDTIRIGGATVVKTADRTTATIGDPVTYTAVVTIPANINLYDVTLRDTLPDSLDYDGPVSATCTSGCGTPPTAITIQPYTPTVAAGVTNIAWDLGDLTAAPTDRIVTIVYKAHVRATHRNGGANVVVGQTAVNSAKVSSDLTNTKTFNPAVIPTVFDDTSPISTATVTVIEPQITVNKKVAVSGGAYVDSAFAQSDDTFSYQIVVTNTGNSPAYDVQVTDQPDAELQGVALAPGVSTTTNTDPWTAGNPAMAWTIPGPIAAGASVTLTYTASLIPAASLSDGETIVNTAAVPHYFGVPAATRALNPSWVFRDYTNGGSDSVTVTLDFPTLTISKTTGRPGFPESASTEWGQSFPWRVVVTNTSATATAKAVNVHDVLPPNWSYDAGSASFSPGGAIAPAITPHAAGDELAWSTGQDLAPGASITLTFSATPSLNALLVSPGPGANVNKADTTAKDEAGNTGNAGGPYAAGPDPATATLLAPALSISKTPDAGAATAGSPTSWQVAVTNTGSGTAHALTVTDVLPAGTTYTPGTATLSPAGGFAEPSVVPGPGAGQTTITWTITSIAAGATKTVTVPVATDPALASGSVLTNASSAVAQDVPAPVSDPGSRIVSTSADLQASKSGPATGVPGGPDLTYTIGVTNHGPSVARSVTLSDPLPLNATFVSATNGCTEVLGLVSCSAGDLAVGGSFSADVVISYPASATGSRTNTVTAASPTPDPGPGPNTASVTTTLDPSADVQITKTASAPSVNNGEDIVYTLVVTNNGISDAAAVSVSDPLPAGTSFVSADAPCAESSGTVTCALGTMIPGASTTLHVTVTATSIGTKDNTATVSTSTPDPDPLNDTSTASVVVDPTADLKATKTAPATANVADTITYTIGATNLGPDDAASVQLSDVLPAGVQFVSADSPCAESGGTVTCSVGGLPSGASVTRDVRVTVLAAAAGTTVSNTSTTGSTTHDPDTSNNDATATTDVAQDADLRLTKTASPAAVLRNHTTTFTLTATNDGPSTAVNATISDPLPAGLQFVSADAGCTEAAGTVTCDLGDLVNGASAARQIVVSGIANGTWTNTATVSSDTRDRDPSNDSASADVVVGPRSDLSITKSAPATVPAGGDITWTLAVTNHGPDDATGVTISDPLPAGVQFVSADAPCTQASGTVTCPVGALAVDATATLTIHGTAPIALADKTLVNTATVMGDQGDGDPTDNTATATTLVGPSADLLVTKQGPATAVAGGTITWTVVVKNNGPSVATNVTVGDTLPAGLTLVSVTPDQGTCAAGPPIACNVGTLPVGATTQVAVVARTAATDVGMSVTNSTSVTGDQPDPDGSNNSATATATTLTKEVSSGGATGGGGTTPSAGVPKLTIRKNVSARRVAAGQRLIYWITVTNTGTGDATNVRICDRLPARLSYLRTPGARFIKGNACWTRAKIAKGKATTVRLEARVAGDVPGGVRITNVAVATSAATRARVAQATVAVRGTRVVRRGAGVTG